MNDNRFNCNYKKNNFKERRRRNSVSMRLYAHSHKDKHTCTYSQTQTLKTNISGIYMHGR